MLLNRVEYLLMNNPVRAAIQRHFEAPRLLRMRGALPGGVALEIGCGRGVGAEVILDLFRADAVHGFDLDPRMVARARRRCARRGSRTRFWVGDATAIAAADRTYDAVFDFGIIHHIPEWREAVTEVRRVLKPGGCFYAEEVLAPFLRHTRGVLKHPERDRFDAATFRAALEAAGFAAVASQQLWHSFAWFVTTRPGS